MVKYLLRVLLISTVGFRSFALIDYSDSASSSGNSNGAIKMNAPRQIPTISQINSGSAEVARGDRLLQGFSLSAKYDALKLDAGTKKGAVNILTFDGHVETPANIFLDLSYSGISSKLISIAPQESSFQSANISILLGLNWLKFGSVTDLAMLNLVGGVNFAPSQSDFSSSRIDKIVAVQTSKRFNTFIIDLGYELTLSGEVDNNQEVDIGNIQKFYSKLGWVVSPDIAFQLEGATVTIKNSDNFTRDISRRLMTEVDFGYLSPKLNLGLGKMVELELGAIFRMTKAQKLEQLVDARLWNTKGLYGDVLYSALILSI